MFFYFLGCLFSDKAVSTEATTGWWKLWDGAFMWLYSELANNMWKPLGQLALSYRNSKTHTHS